MTKQKQPWKPEQDHSESNSGISLGNLLNRNAENENDPSLERVQESMVRLGGSKYRAAREQRLYHRHFSPKARLKKKMLRRAQKKARRAQRMGE
jgi:hypothetical protein